MAASSTTSTGASASSTEASLPPGLQQAIAYDRTQWTNGSVTDDGFYATPPDSGNAPPGKLLKVEEITNTSLYTIPPGLSMSRIIYQSKTLNGTSVPVSAYVLWPYSARKSKSGNQVVLWAHGTTGITPNCAPSHYINVYFHYFGPFTLALQGYVVVASDYSGLGISKTASGKNITHEYSAAPAQANDAVYSFKAAREAFPQLGKEFVVMGHSVGGGTAWSVAQRQVKEPVEGYLGAVAISPVTNVLKNPEPVRSWIIGASVPGLQSIYPNLKKSDLMTATGEERIDLAMQVGGNTAILLGILAEGNAALFKPNFTQNPTLEKFASVVENGRQEFAGPLLVIQGTGDKLVNADVTSGAVNDTKKMFPSADLHYVQLPGLDHTPTVPGSQSVWMDWIADRFAGKPTSSSNTPAVDDNTRPLTAVQPETNWYLALEKVAYEVY